jgi:outer membrane receptor protein involved in Fe transport
VEQIERIEVVRGSVLYGDNAVAGVINTTKSPSGKFNAGASRSATTATGRCPCRRRVRQDGGFAARRAATGTAPTTTIGPMISAENSS